MSYAMYFIFSQFIGFCNLVAYSISMKSILLFNVCIRFEDQFCQEPALPFVPNFMWSWNWFGGSIIAKLWNMFALQDCKEKSVSEIWVLFQTLSRNFASHFHKNVAIVIGFHFYLMVCSFMITIFDISSNVLWYALWCY